MTVGDAPIGVAIVVARGGGKAQERAETHAMVIAAPVEQGRHHFAARAWGAAHAELVAADEATGLEAADLDLLAVAAYLTGRDDESADAWARAHRGWLERSEPHRAARSAFWVGLSLLLKGEMAPANGWLERARSLVDAEAGECAERGYLMVPRALMHLGEGDVDGARRDFECAAEIGERLGDADLRALGQLGMGQALMHLGDIARGVALLDESMVGVTAGEVTPLVAGILYCAVIEACHEVFDLRRAKEWTTALSRWCDSQPDLVLYRGQCLVHRAQILQQHGEWDDALLEARRACTQLEKPPGQAARGAAYYQEAELHRLRGAHADAEEGYRSASRWGCSPHPGLALLRLAQGRTADAIAAIRRVTAETDDRLMRARYLGPLAEIAITAGELNAARSAAEELQSIADDVGAPLLQALATDAAGAVELAGGTAVDALVTLRRAWGAWRDLEAPYEAARVRVRLANALELLEDADGARLELDAARIIFQDLGATSDLAALDDRMRRASPPASGGLTARETQIVALVARGLTNRAVAEELVISEKTVARHLSNVFTKLGVSSRSAVTGWAYEHGVVAPST